MFDGIRMDNFILFKVITQKTSFTMLQNYRVCYPRISSFFLIAALEITMNTSTLCYSLRERSLFTAGGWMGLRRGESEIVSTT